MINPSELQVGQKIRFTHKDASFTMEGIVTEKADEYPEDSYIRIKITTMPVIVIHRIRKANYDSYDFEVIGEAKKEP